MPNNEPIRPPLRSANSATDPSRLRRGRTRHTRHATATNGNPGLQNGVPVASNPAAWIRSASTSSLRKLKRTAAGHPSQSFGLSPSGTHLDALLAGQCHSSSTTDILIAKLDPRSPSLSPIRTRGISVEPISEDQPLPSIDQEIETTPGSTDPVILSSEEMDEDVVLDVLPSFEMYNTLHRHIPQGNVNPDIHDFPPSYGEASNNGANGGLSRTSNSSSSTLNSGNIVPPSIQVNNSDVIPESNEGFGIPTESPYFRVNHSRSSSSLHDITNESGDEVGVEDDFNDNDNIFIDKVYTLPKLSTPVEIDIRVTKHASLPPLKPENESMLKEYTSGDTVHGYCIIENKSNHPVKFEMLYVTLEGYVSVVDKAKGKRTVKRFLRMVDLSASWSYTNIELGTGLKYKSWGVDSDNSILGLKNNRILEPGVRHKKFFVFKLPNQLLDTTCKQEHFAHCLLPPSMGVDKYKNHCKYAGIDVNNTLGCGHLASKGSPILTFDLAGNDLSVNYTVDARIVGKDPKTQKLSLMREREYNIRFIPFGFHASIIGEQAPAGQLKDLKVLIEERLDVLKKVFDRVAKNETIRNTDIYGTDLVGTVDETSDLNSDDIMQRKLDQLHIRNRTGYNGKSSSAFDDIKKFEPKENIIESELKYKIKGKSSSKNLFAGFLSSNSRSSSPHRRSTNSSTTSMNSLEAQESCAEKRKKDKAGIILLASNIPTEALQYHSPHIIQKANDEEQRTKHSQENWIRLMESLPDEEKKTLKQLKVNLSCLQSNNSIDHEPPEIQSITTELVVITAKSENSIPIKLDSDLLLNTSKLNNISDKFTEYLEQIQNSYDKFTAEKDKINKLYNVYRHMANEVDLRFSDFIPNQLCSNVESLANLSVKVDVLGEVFKKQLDTLKEGDRRHSDTVIVGSRYGNARGSLGTTSGSSHSRSNVSNRYTSQILRKWEKKGPSHYEREVNINLEYVHNLVQTILPSFESCLCCRFYCVRVHIKFHHVGSCSIDVPVMVKNFET